MKTIQTFLLSLGIVGIVLLVFFGWVIVPLLALWAVNVILAPWHIPYTFWTWLAMLILRITFTSQTTIKTRDSSSRLTRFGGFDDTSS
jgi:hypothetical protein